LKKLTVIFAICALVPFTLAACGDDDEEETTAATTTEEPAADTGGGGETVAVSAVPDGSFAFEQDTLETAAGPVTFEFDNPATLGHDFCIEQDGTEVDCTEVISEDSTTLESDLEAGEYTFYCDVTGHREGGMEGTLTVE
jgi:plastocyanin